jgi:rSAM/selenodomain-associated transferase 1
MRGDVVVVMARAPRLGAVKRRLARGIGPHAALRFHQAMLARTIRLVARDRRHAGVLAVTPRRARVAGLPNETQPEGDLGRRMAAAFARRPLRRVVLIGCDIPGLSAADLAAAFRALGRADAVFGPALDGGYWLVGMARRRPAHPFRHVRWSGPHALADTLRNFRGLRVATLRALRDVDDAADLAALGLGPPPPA